MSGPPSSIDIWLRMRAHVLDFMIFAASLGALLGIEVISRAFERRAIGNTRVATVPQSDHQIDPVGQAFRWGALIAGTGALMGLWGIGILWPFGAVIFIIFGVLRAGIVLFEKALAHSGRDARLHRALAQPPFAEAPLALFFSAVDLRTPDHVTVWDTYIDNIELPWFIITVEYQHFAALTAQGRANVVFLSSLASQIHALPESVRLMLYANNAQKNRLVLKALPDVAHAQILHGDSDKPPSYSPLTKNYDYVFVAGQMAIDRYARNGVHIPKERFHVVGRPQIADIVPAKAKPAQMDRPTIVYMPTWRGFFEDTQFSSLDRADQIIKVALSLSRPAHVIFKPHPLSYKDPEWGNFNARIQSALRINGTSGAQGEVSSSDLSPFDLYNRADLLICDISSVMIDFLYSHKPFVTLLPKAFTPDMQPNFPSLEAAYTVTADLGNLKEQLEAALGPDPIEAQREYVRAAAFGDLDCVPGEAFRTACRKLVGQQNRR